MELYDMHCHLDFFGDPAQVARDAAELGLGMLAVTVEPSGYERTAPTLADAPNVTLGVGLHPWWVADGRCKEADVARAAELVRATRFAGEVGIDLSPKHVPPGSQDAQVAAFRAMSEAAAEPCDQGRRILSIHAVRAAGLVLDILEGTGCLRNCCCIFHWFTGSSDELHRAVSAGCWFSVNEWMLGTRRGREYARQLPLARLLTETDLPPQPATGYGAAQVVESLERTLARLGEIRGTDVRHALAANACELLEG